MVGERLLIVGAGGFAREVAWLVESLVEAGESIRIVGFADDDVSLQGQMLNGYPVASLETVCARLRPDTFVVAVGGPKTREALVTRALAAQMEPATLIHPRVERSRFLKMGRGVVICAGCILTTDIVLGDYTQLNLGCTIGHDVILENYSTLAPGVHVSGNVRLGTRSYVGTGAVIVNGTSVKPVVIGNDAVVGAGACVTKSVASGVTVVGVPARELTRGG